MFPLGYIPKTAGQGRSMWCQYLISVFEYFLKWFCRFTLPAMVPSLPYHLLVGFYWLKQFPWCFGASYISLLRGRSTSASWALILPILAPPVRIVYSYKLSLLGFCLVCFGLAPERFCCLFFFFPSGLVLCVFLCVSIYKLDIAADFLISFHKLYAI